MGKARKGLEGKKGTGNIPLEQRGAPRMRPPGHIPLAVLGRDFSRFLASRKPHFSRFFSLPEGLPEGLPGPHPELASRRPIFRLPGGSVSCLNPLSYSSLRTAFRLWRQSASLHPLRHPYGGLRSAGWRSGG
jgi:hypothetical protein